MKTFVLYNEYYNYWIATHTLAMTLKIGLLHICQTVISKCNKLINKKCNIIDSELTLMQRMSLQGVSQRDNPIVKFIYSNQELYKKTFIYIFQKHQPNVFFHLIENVCSL